MKTLLSATLAATLALSAGTAYAGGPVIIVDEPEVVAEKPRSGALLPLLLVGVVLCVALCGGDDDEEEVVGPEIVLDLDPVSGSN